MPVRSSGERQDYWRGAFRSFSRVVPSAPTIGAQPWRTSRPATDGKSPNQATTRSRATGGSFFTILSWTTSKPRQPGRTQASRRPQPGSINREPSRALRNPNSSRKSAWSPPLNACARRRLESRPALPPIFIRFRSTSVTRSISGVVCAARSNRPRRKRRPPSPTIPLSYFPSTATWRPIISS